MKTCISQNLTEVELAAALGFPPTLFGFTPDQRGYWHEPHLPWVPRDWHEQGPPTPHGPGVWAFSEVKGPGMAPRFPAGCRVNLAPVYCREALVVGKVYVYLFNNPATGQTEGRIGRLTAIHGNYLTAAVDNEAAELPDQLWLLREVPGQELWDLREVTHYVEYPELS